MFNKILNSDKYLKQYLPENINDFIESIKAGHYGNTQMVDCLYTPYCPGSNKQGIIVLPDSSRDVIFGTIPENIHFFILNSIYAFPNIITNWYFTRDTEAMIRSACVSTTESNDNVTGFVDMLKELAVTYGVASQLYMDLDKNCINSSKAATDWMANNSNANIVKHYSLWCDLLFKLHYKEIANNDIQTFKISSRLFITSKDNIILLDTTRPYSSTIANSIALACNDFHNSDKIGYNTVPSLLKNSELSAKVTDLNKHLITFQVTHDYSNFKRINNANNTSRTVYWDGLFGGMIFNNFLNKKHYQFNGPHSYKQSANNSFIEFTRSTFGWYDNENEEIDFNHDGKSTDNLEQINYTLDKLVLFTHESISSVLEISPDHPNIILGFVISHAFSDVSKSSLIKDVLLSKSGLNELDIILDMSDQLLEYCQLKYNLLRDRYNVIDVNKTIVAPDQILPICKKQLLFIKEQFSNKNMAAVNQLMVIIEHWVNLYNPIPPPYAINNDPSKQQPLPILMKSLVVGRDLVYNNTYRVFDGQRETFLDNLVKIIEFKNQITKNYF